MLAFLLTLLSGTLGWFDGLGRSDQTLYDAALNLMPHAPRPDVVIIGIDEQSLAQIGRWPWPRAVHAALLERLGAAHPRAVGLDLILAEPEQAAGDTALAQALKQAGNVVLPVLREGTGEQPHVSLPTPALAQSAAALGHIHLEIDADGIARSAFLREGLGAPASPQAAGWPHFALALRDLGGAAQGGLPGERRSTPPGAGWARDYWMHIPFAGPPGTFAHYSYVDVLKGTVPAAQFAGKYVLVGATAVGMGDDFPTPVSGRSRPMPGIEISANLLDALLEGRAIVRAGAFANALLSVVPVLLLMLCLLLFSPRRGLLAVGALIALTLGLAFVLLRAGGVWFAPSAALAGLVLAYPLWSWRRLEATLRYLGAEFLRLDAEPRVLPDDPRAAALPGTDLLERRILAVEAAAYRLRAARRFASGTLESLPDATVVADRDGSVLIANRAAAALFQAQSPEQLRGQAIGSLVASFAPKAESGRPLEWTQLREMATAAPTEAGAPPSLELVSRDGRELLSRCAGYTDVSGATAGWIVSLVDISPLREAERSRDEVLSFLSHDMRSPQSSILALLELHELDPDDNPKEEVHQRIAQYAHRTLELSEQFLQLARAETKEYELETVDLGVIAEEALEEAWAAAEQKHITLTLRFDGEPVPVKADPALLRRALINLLTNAVKYSPDDTTTIIQVEARAGWAVCSVTDQGYGMSEDNLQNLFKRFRRFSRPGQPKAQGAGLGMAFVKTVAERLGGRILVESMPEVGTTFTLQLPQAD